MHLGVRSTPVEGGTDIHDHTLPPLLHAGFKHTLGHVECAQGINLKHSLHSISRNLLSCRQEVTCSPVHKHIDLAEPLNHILADLLARLDVSDVAGLRMAGGPQRPSNLLILFFIPRHEDHSLSPVVNELLSNLLEHAPSRSSSDKTDLTLHKLW